MKIISFKKIILVFVSTLVSLVVLEILLKALGYKPWENIIVNEKPIFKPDAVLGWKAKKGTYEIKTRNESIKKFQMNFGENSERIINSKNQSGKEILMIGGSFTQGWGVNDYETFSHKFQKEFENFKVYNFAQGGYGSVQSLLMLEKQITKMQSPRLVVYGLIAHHEYRNVARARWLHTLAKYSRRGHVSTPYAILGKDNKLLMRPPTSYINLPLREKSSLITLFEKTYMKLKTKHRKKQQLLVTKKIILEMKNISSNYSADFILLILDLDNPNKKNNYINYFKNNKINYVDCSVSLVGEMILPGDYHPSGKAHSYYNECLVNYINKTKIIKKN